MKHVTLKNQVTQTGQNKAGDTVEHCVTECYHVTKLYIDTRKDIKQAVCSTYYYIYTIHYTVHTILCKTDQAAENGVYVREGEHFPEDSVGVPSLHHRSEQNYLEIDTLHCTVSPDIRDLFCFVNQSLSGDLIHRKN